MNKSDWPLGMDITEWASHARNAFDVMMRRGWSTTIGEADGKQVFFVDDAVGDCISTPQNAFWSDPFTALVEADAWYKENVERG